MKIFCMAVKAADTLLFIPFHSFGQVSELLDGDTGEWNGMKSNEWGDEDVGTVDILGAARML